MERLRKHHGNCVAHNQLRQRIEKIADDPTGDVAVRLTAIEAVPGKLSRKRFAFVFDLVESERGSEPANRGIEILRESKLSNDELLEVVELVPTAGPLELRDLLSVLQGVGDDVVASSVARKLQTARSRQTLTTSEIRDFAKSWNEAATVQLQPLLIELEELQRTQAEKLTRIEPHVKYASTERGRKVFFNEKSKCVTCHRIGDQGGKIGPDLTTIGRIRRERDLLEAILFPSNSFAREYEPYSIATSDGKVYTGLIAHETADKISIQQTTGDPIEIARDDIETIAPSPVSVMPQGLETGLSESELADLVAYLKSLTSSREPY